MISNVGTFTIFTQVEKDLQCIRDSKGVQWSMLSSKSMCCTFLFVVLLNVHVRMSAPPQFIFPAT